MPTAARAAAAGGCSSFALAARDASLEGPHLCGVAAGDVFFHGQADLALRALLDLSVTFVTQILEGPVLDTEAGRVRVPAAVKRQDVREFERWRFGVHLTTEECEVSDSCD